jgi:hypothetical protein
MILNSRTSSTQTSIFFPQPPQFTAKRSSLAFIVTLKSNLPARFAELPRDENACSPQVTRSGHVEYLVEALCRARTRVTGVSDGALGFRVHSGWTAMVAVAGSPASPVVLDRRRIETADTAIRA